MSSLVPDCTPPDLEEEKALKKGAQGTAPGRGNCRGEASRMGVKCKPGWDSGGGTKGDGSEG